MLGYVYGTSFSFTVAQYTVISEIWAALESLDTRYEEVTVPLGPCPQELRRENQFLLFSVRSENDQQNAM